MFTTNTLKRLMVTLTLAIGLCAFGVPQALGAGPLDGRSPDTRDAAQKAQSVSGGYGARDGWYGYAVSLTQASTSTPVLDGRSPDTRDAAQSAQAINGSRYGARDGWYGYAVSLTQASTSTPVLDGRSPDTRDFAALAHSPVVTITRSPGFQWGDFGIGIAAALGATLVLGLCTRLLAARQDREQQHPVATA